MLNREYRPVSVITFVNETDKYGQPRQTIASVRPVEMVCKIYSQTSIQDPLYNNVELIGITKDQDISDENQIRFDNMSYNILHVIPSGKYLQVLMKKV